MAATESYKRAALISPWSWFVQCTELSSPVRSPCDLSHARSARLFVTFWSHKAGHLITHRPWSRVNLFLNLFLILTSFDLELERCAST
jgi:hypothetical protein